MAFALLIIGIVLLTASIRNTQTCLIQVLQSDFIGPANFTYWIIAFIVVGAVGYIDKLKKVSDAFLVLIFVALILSRGSTSGTNGNFFGKFLSAIKGTDTAKPISGTSLFPTAPGATAPGVTIGPGGIRIGPNNPSPYPIPTGPTGLPSFPGGGGYGSPSQPGVLEL